MSTDRMVEREVRPRRTSHLVGWGLLAGGAIFFVGGAMHPKEDPPGVSAKEHLRVMYVDPAWYPAHALLLIGMLLIAATLVAVARRGTLAATPRAQTVGIIAAVAATLGALGMLLHLVAAIDADRIAAHRGTPITDVLGIVETLTVPAFGFSIAALAVVGSLTRVLGTLGHSVSTALAVAGGVGYGLAGGTILFTDRFDFLFPAASGIGVWAVAAGIGLLLGSRAVRPGEAVGDDQVSTTATVSASSSTPARTQ